MGISLQGCLAYKFRTDFQLMIRPRVRLVRYFDNNIIKAFLGVRDSR